MEKEISRKVENILNKIDLACYPIYAKLTQFGSAPRDERKLLQVLKDLQVDLLTVKYLVDGSFVGFLDCEEKAIYRKYVIYRNMGKPVPSIEMIADKLGKTKSAVATAISKTKKKMLDEGILVCKDGRTSISAKVLSGDIDDFSRNFISTTKRSIESSYTQTGVESRKRNNHTTNLGT